MKTTDTNSNQLHNVTETDAAAVHEHIEAIMPGLESQPSGPIQFPYLLPTYGQHYGGAFYTWDHFHMALRFAYAGKPEYLRYQVDNMLVYQRENGFVPSFLHPAIDPNAFNWHAQPFLAQAAFVYAARTEDYEWAVKVFSKLEKYIGFYERESRASNGLFVWAEAYMSGFDNDAATSFLPSRTVMPCDLSSWLFLEYKSLSLLAERIGRIKDGGNYRQKSKRLRELINRELWLDNVGSFSAFNLAAGSHQFRYSDPYLDDSVGRYSFQTCSNLIPLYTGVAYSKHAEVMIRKYVLNEEHFLSAYGIRSLSRSSEYYNNAVWGNPPRFGDSNRLTNSNWQGPVWIPLCYFMFHALRLHGFRKEAEDLANRTLRVLAMSLKRIGSFTENFDSETGAPLYATKFASWNILSDMMRKELSEDFWIMKHLYSE
ncbi:MAG: hypothetical protein HY350_04310 [Candidatus Omnitrophica bacterium]|nr:hypothetical protein [Candidatus Omnitrophota bacterium]